MGYSSRHIRRTALDRYDRSQVSSGASSTAGTERSDHVPARCSTFDALTVTIVMGTYHGERFLKAQLNSFAAQTHPHWQLYVSDDGSSDSTCAMVREFAAARRGKNLVILVNGPHKGCATNFLTALCQAPEAHYYAYADQDDLWCPEKLARALSFFTHSQGSRPALYCGRTRLVDVADRPIGLSPAFLRRPSFANAIVQSIGGANTMVMNHAARELLRAAGPEVDVVSHDWWTYQLVSGAGGSIHYDLEPMLFYRQHESNLIGANNTLKARLKRMRLLLNGGFKAWNDRNVRTLDRVRYLLKPENRALLDTLIEVRSRPLPRNLLRLYKSGIQRQTIPSNLMLFVAAAFKKL